MEKLFAEMKSIAFAEYVKDFWQRYLGKPHYEREIMDAGLVMKIRAFAATWVDGLQTGTLKSHRRHDMRSQGSNQFSCDDCLVAPN
jgi:hypothetical protein